MGKYQNITGCPGYSKGKVKQCFQILDVYKGNASAIPHNCGVCKGIIKNNIINKKCINCKHMNKETQHYIENKMCCACKHFGWLMGEMGACDFKNYNTVKKIGEWSDSCNIDKFEYKE